MRTLVAIIFLSIVLLSHAEEVVDADVSKEVNKEAESEKKEAKDIFADADRQTIEKSGEKFEFQAEVGRLMDIIINSLYTNREIFMRELISNAADATDKIRYESLTDKSKLGTTTELDIRIQVDKDSNTLTITDKGCGMARDHLIKYLGTVASSGTTEFLKKMKASENSVSLIGQFGVGFYSVYLVAERVTVISKHNDDEQYVWQSTANRTFSISKDPRGNTLGRGTQVVLHLKEDAREFLQEDTIKKMITKYSEFIQYPIYLLQHREEEKEVVDEEATKAAEEEEKKKAAEDAAKEGEKKEEEVEKKEETEKKEGDEMEVKEEEEEKNEEKKPKMKKVKETIAEWIQLNTLKAIWTRDPSNVTDEEYDNFYKSIAKDEQGSLAHVHFTAEGGMSFRSILYIPKKCPEGFYDRLYEKSQSLKLYVRKVLISEEFEANFMPRYLNFIKGVVDSDDLPLNVNREQLAQSKVLQLMGKKLTRKALKMIAQLAGDEEQETAEPKADEQPKEEEKNKYEIFWKEFGKSIKFGVIDDKDNKKTLAKLLRFQTTKSNGTYRSFAQYISDKQEKQRDIYYITGANLDIVKNSPMLEKLRKVDYEVIYFVDPLDEYVLSALPEYEGLKLVSVSKDKALRIGDEEIEKKKIEKKEEELKDLISWLKGVYGEKIEKVKVTNRLENSPCVIVTSQYGWSANMERIMKAQTFADQKQFEWMLAKKTMEINPRHPIIMELQKRTKETPDDKALKDLANMMLDSALLASGFHLDNPLDLAKRMQNTLSHSLNVDPEAPLAPEEEYTEPETKETETEEEVTEEAEEPAPEKPKEESKPKEEL
eukprot:TRINITY_DN6112_c0_g1_i1.p1 TRINITY_DN6112_c0_g1~~TRINITY_DN6112_c0_g1_i1.p1  ORF type:complete len:839 (+),score=293.93 TRINITY_DN6112_c0_g1_i1:41-2518(+)